MDLNNFFSAVRDQFAEIIPQKISRGNIFRQLIPQGEWNHELGMAPTAVTYTHELPTGYPTDMVTVALSNGTGDAACNPDSTEIVRGEMHRTYQLSRASFKTPMVCVEDIKRSHQAAKAAAAQEQSLVKFINVWWSDWYRLKNIAMSDNKVSVTGASTLEIVESTKGDFTDLTTLPAAELNWTHLDQLYTRLLHSEIADDVAIGYANGAPVIPLVLSAELKRKLFRDDEDKREQIKYIDANTNLAALGTTHAINGFAPVVDLYAMRFGKTGGIESTADLTLANAIYPTKNVAASKGKRSVNNELYNPNGVNGGLAEFEVVQILPKNVWRALVDRPNPTTFGGMKFNAQNYVGAFKWVNNPDMTTNVRGNMGFYLADVAVAAEPHRTEFGYTILSKVVGASA